MKLSNWTGSILGAVAVAGLLTFTNVAAMNTAGSSTELGRAEATSIEQNAFFGDMPYCATQAVAVPKGTDLSPTGVDSTETQAVLVAAGDTPESDCFATGAELMQFVASQEPLR